MRHILIVVALFLCGCAATKFNVGYDFAGQKFFAEIERPLEQGLKK